MSNTDINAIGRSYTDYQEQQRVPKQDLGQKDFLSLMAAQLKYQDPMEPSKDSDFVAQLAQFNSLNQLEQLNNTTSFYQSYTMVGKYVVAEVTADGGEPALINGVVDAVMNKDGVAYVEVGGYVFKASCISEVYDKDLFKDDNPLLSALSLIGRTVTANMPTDGEEVVPGAEEAEETEEGAETAKPKQVTGKVVRVAAEEDWGMVAYLKTGDGSEVRVPVAYIIDIKE